MNEINIDEYVGIVLVDGLIGAEERLMDSIGDMTNVSFVGGSAGDDLKFECTYVYADGKVYTNAAVLVLMKLKTKFEIIKTQSFNVLDAKLKVTKVNENTREVISFNNKPAVQAYAEAVGVSADQAPNYFMSNPVGLVVDQDNVYVRSPQKVEGESIIFYCSIAEGLEVSLLESTDIVKDTKAAVTDKKNKLGEISGLINFNCILRTLELENKEKTGEYGENIQRYTDGWILNIWRGVYRAYKPDSYHVSIKISVLQIDLNFVSKLWLKWITANCQFRLGRALSVFLQRYKISLKSCYKFGN